MRTHDRHFALVDALRGFAAITVVVYHAIDFFNWHEFATAYGLIWFRWGWMGVDIFFVISGFVITLSALNQRDRNGYDNFKSDFLWRARRILPLHYLTLALFLIFSSAVIHPNILYDVIAHLLFIHNTIPAFHYSINAPNWSLGVEMQFYFLIAFGIYYIKKSKSYIFTSHICACLLYMEVNCILYRDCGSSAIST